MGKTSSLDEVLAPAAARGAGRHTMAPVSPDEATAANGLAALEAELRAVRLRWFTIFVWWRSPVRALASGLVRLEPELRHLIHKLHEGPRNSTGWGEVTRRSVGLGAIGGCARSAVASARNRTDVWMVSVIAALHARGSADERTRMARRGADGVGAAGALLLRFIIAFTVAIEVTGCASLDEPPQTEQVTVRELFISPERFDNRFVALTGRASVPRAEFSGARSTQVFRLDDGAQAIEVRSLVGLGACPPTLPVTVEGWFRATGRGIGSGVIEAVRVVCRKSTDDSDRDESRTLITRGDGNTVRAGALDLAPRSPAIRDGRHEKAVDTAAAVRDSAVPPCCSWTGSGNSARGRE